MDNKPDNKPDEKTIPRWHDCFGAWKDQRNCGGCIEEADCKKATASSSDAAMKIDPPKKVAK